MSDSNLPMRAVPSAEFRVIYARLDEPVAVTSVGRIIGYYYPAGPAPRPAHPEPEGVPNDADRVADGQAGAPGSQRGAAPQGVTGAGLGQAARPLQLVRPIRPAPKPKGRS